MLPLSDRRLLRLLRGELPPAEAERLRARIEREPRLARRLASLAAIWERLAPPPLSAPPPNLVAGVLDRLRQEEVASPRAARPRLGTLWAQAVPALALVGGIAAGVVLATMRPTTPPDSIPSEVETLSDAYWLALTGDAPAEENQP